VTQVKRALWIASFAGIAVWSLLTWGTYALVTGTGDFLVANAELLGGGAELQYWMQWTLRLVEQFGVVLLWIVWAIGTVLLLGAAAVGGKALAAVRRMQQLR
jgi:hypothetical protein